MKYSVTLFLTLTIVGSSWAQAPEWDDPITTSNWNHLWRSSFVQSSASAANAPESGGWFWGINMNHSSNTSTYKYNGQIAIKNDHDLPTMYFRSTNQSGEGTWAKVLGSFYHSSISGDLASTGSLRVIGDNLDSDNLSFMQNSSSLLVGWNRSGGHGETTFIANRGAGSTGGFEFRDLSNGGTERMLLKLSGDGNVGVGTSYPTAVLHVTGTSYDPTPEVSGTQIRQGVIELTADNGAPFIDFQNDISGTDYDARLRLTSNDMLRIEGSNFGLANHQLQEVRAIQLKDWDDSSGGIDNKYRLLARDGAFHFYNGGLVVGQYSDNTWSDLADGTLVVQNKLGIGTTTPSEKLEVNGTIRSREVKVEANHWPDYVFEPDYDLRSLQETEQFIQTNNHLPEIPSAMEVEENGIALSEMNALLLKKIEELTLHMISQQNQIEAQSVRLEEQNKRIQNLEKQQR